MWPWVCAPGSYAEKIAIPASFAGAHPRRYRRQDRRVDTPELLRTHSARLFGWIAEGKLKVHIGGVYPLADAAKAHADMASRATTGKLLLMP